MDRTRRNGFRPRLIAIPLVLMCALPLGCNLFKTGYYMLRGFETEAPYPGLKEKTVVVVCRSPRSVNPEQATSMRLVPARVAELLSTNGKKINVIDPLKVERWIDENGFEDFAEVGEALDADMVVGINLEDYGLYRSSSIYQGNVAVSVKVYDLTEGPKKLVHDVPYNQIQFPPSGGMPAGEMGAPEFNRMFVDVIAEKIARNFYDHDHTSNFAPDSQVLR